MARTAIVPVAASRNGDIAETQTAVDQANGMVIAAANPDKLVLRITNTAAAQHNAIIRGGDSIYPAWMSGQGDLTFAVAASTGVVYAGPFDSARVLQSDRSLHLDFDSGFAGEVTAVSLP